MKINAILTNTPSCSNLKILNVHLFLRVGEI